jgi:hypothetical protein
MADFGVLIFGVCFIFACLILELLLINQNKTTSKITQFMVFQLILNCGLGVQTMALKIQVLVWHNYDMNHHLWPADSSFYKGRFQCLGSEQ